jgi:hypothetical protein
MSGCVIENGKGDPLLSLYSLYLLILFPLPLLQLQLVSCSVEIGKDDPLLSLYSLYLLIPFPLPLLQLQLVGCSVENGKDDPLLSFSMDNTYSFSSLSRFSSSSLSAVPLRMAKTTLSFLSLWTILTHSLSLSRFSSSSLSAVPLRMAKTTLSFLSLWTILTHSLPSQLLQLQLIGCSVENGKDDPLLSLYGQYLLILFPLPLL